MQEKLQEIFSQHYRKRDALIPILQDIQGAFGYLPPEAMTAAGKFCRMDPVEVYGVATFYAQFKFSPMGRNLAMVCQGTACHVMGGARVLQEVADATGRSRGGDHRRRSLDFGDGGVHRRLCAGAGHGGKQEHIRQNEGRTSYGDSECKQRRLGFNRERIVSSLFAEEPGASRRRRT